MPVRALPVWLTALACVAACSGDDDCSLPPGRYSVHAHDPTGAYPDRDFVQLNETETSCHVTDGSVINGAVLDLECNEFDGQYYCNGEAYTAAVRYQVTMSGPLR